MLFIFRKNSFGLLLNLFNHFFIVLSSSLLCKWKNPHLFFITFFSPFSVDLIKIEMKMGQKLFVDFGFGYKMNTFIETEHDTFTNVFFLSQIDFSCDQIDWNLFLCHFTFWMGFLFKFKIEIDFPFAQTKW